MTRLHLLNGSGPDTCTDARVAAVIELIAADPRRNWTVVDLADSVQISTSHLRRLFKTALGVSPAEYVKRRRLYLAAELLTTSQRPVKDIMRDVGIVDASHFTRDFRAVFGSPPTEYRHSCNRQLALGVTFQPMSDLAYCQAKPDSAINLSAKR